MKTIIYYLIITIVLCSFADAFYKEHRYQLMADYMGLSAIILVLVPKTKRKPVEETNEQVDRT